MFGKENYSRRRYKPLKVLFFIAVFLVIVASLSWLVMFLWNTILTDAVGVKPLTFWKAMGLLLLAKILFGGFGRGRGGWKRSPRGHWRNKWMNMSDEERSEAKTRWKEHCKKRGSWKDWKKRNEEE